MIRLKAVPGAGVFSFHALCLLICNPLGYEKPEYLYAHDRAWPDTSYLSIFGQSEASFTYGFCHIE